MEDGVRLWFMLVVAILATWRITHLLAEEDGPGDIILRIRIRLGDGLLGQLMDCFNCLSVWVAAPMALAVSRGPLEWMLAWFALSGAACLLERIGQAALVVQPAAQVELRGRDDGMLRTETANPEEQADVHTDTG